MKLIASVSVATALLLGSASAARAGCLVASAGGDFPVDILTDARDAGALLGRTPLLLIHGLNSTYHTWDEFLTFWFSGQGVALRARYQPFLVSYDSGVCSYNSRSSLFDRGAWLRDAIERRHSYPDAALRWPAATNVVIVAHSMGGLLARSFMQSHWFSDGTQCGERVLRLITVATPHHGSPAANADVDAVDWIKISSLGWDGYDGAYDDGNTPLKCLNSYSKDGPAGAQPNYFDACPLSNPPEWRRRAFYSRTIAYGAFAFDYSDVDGIYNATWPVVVDLGFVNDGIVPIVSALLCGPSGDPCVEDSLYPVLKRVFFAHCDHSRILQLPANRGCNGDDGRSVFAHLREDLLAVPPDLGVALDAPVSGSAPFVPTIVATAAPHPSANATYRFWNDCASTAASATACGTPEKAGPDPTFLTTYANAGTYTAKVVVERAGQWAEARRTITVTAPGAACSDAYRNGSAATAAPVYSGQTLSAKICSVLEQDYFRIATSSAGTLRLTMTPPAQTDLAMSLLSSSLGLLSANPQGAGVAETVTYAAPAAGSFYVKVYGNDASNAASSYTLSYAFSGAGTDLTPPSVTITGPTSSPTWPTGLTPLIVSGTAGDNVAVSIVQYTNTTTGAWGQCLGTSLWSATVPLTTGANVIRVKAFDTSGNSAEDTLTATYTPAADGTPPALTITSPPSGTAASSPIAVSGTAIDGQSGIQSVTWTNGTQSGSATGTISWSIPALPLSNGLNQVNVRATNGAGLSTTQTLSLLYNAADSQAPALTQSAPCSLSASFPSCTYSIALMLPGSVRFAGHASDDVGVAYVRWTSRTRSSGTATGTGDWWFDLPVVDGLNLVDVQAFDGAGHASLTLTSWLYVSSGEPQVAITFPANPTHTTTASSILLQGTASAPFGFASLGWSNSRGGSGSIPPGTSWTSPAVPLQPGENVVTVSVADVQSHTKSASVTVSYTPPLAGNLTWIPKRSLAGATSEPGAYAAIGSTIYVTGATGALNLDAYDTSTDTWRRLAQVPHILDGAAAINGKIYGLGRADPFWVLCLYDAASDSWSTESTAVPSRQWPAVVALGGKLLAIGGYQAGGRVDAYDPATHAWSARAPMILGRSQFGASVLAGKVYVVGGNSDSGSMTQMTEVYDPVADRWTGIDDQILPDPQRPRRRAALALVTLGQRLYVLGGHSYSSPFQPMPDAEEYSPAPGWWRGVNAPSQVHYLPGAAAVNGKLYLIGGFASNGQGVPTSVEEGTLTPDSAPPAVEIAAPTRAATWATNAPTVTLSGRARDNVAVAALGWTNGRGGSGTLTLPAYEKNDLGWTASDIPLQLGETVVTVTATDLDGNATSGRLTVTYSLPVAPELVSFDMNRGAGESSSRTVTLDNGARLIPLEYLASERADFSGAVWKPYATAPRFLLSGGNGPKRVFLKLRNAAGESYTLSDDIVLEETAAGASTFTLRTTVSCAAGQYHRLAVDSTGAVYVLCWYGAPSANGYQLALHRSSDGGGTFHAPVPIPDSQNVTNGLDLFVDASDVLHVVWMDYNGVTPEVYYARSTDHGSTWTARRKIRTGALWSGYQARTAAVPQVASNGDGVVYVGFMAASHDSGGSYLASGLWLAKSTDGGASFGPEFAIDRPVSGSDPEMKRLRVFGGEFRVLFTRAAAGTIHPYYVRGTAGDLANLPILVEPANAPGYLYYAEDMAHASSGSTVYAAIRQAAYGSAVYAVRSLDSGATWGDRVQLDEANTLTDLGRLNVDRRGALHYVVRDTSFSRLMYTDSTDGGGTFALPIPAIDPAHAGFVGSAVDDPRGLLYISTDLASGQIAIARGSIALDPEAPTVAITSPTTSASYATNLARLTLSGWANDNVAVSQVRWSNDRGGSGVASGTSVWRADDIPLQPGTNVLTVTATDRSGSVATAMLAVTTNATVPNVAITSPTSAASYVSPSPTITLGGTASDADGVARVEWTSNAGFSGRAAGTAAWSAAAIPLQSGTNILTVTAYDAAGNSRSATLTVSYSAGDVLPPSVLISSPTPAATYATTAASIAVSGTAGDDRALTSVTWSSDRGPSGVATGTNLWSIGAVPLSLGVNVLTVTSHDAAGNTGSAALTVTRGLTLQLLSPLGGEVWEPGSLHRISWTSAYLDPAGVLQVFYEAPGLDWQYLGELPATATFLDWTVPTNVDEIRVFVGHRVGGDWSVSATSGALRVEPPLSFYTLQPCRLVDTRTPAGTYGGPALQAGSTRVFPLAGRCGIPATARAVSVNLTETQSTATGHFRLYPAGLTVPAVSSINYLANQTRANNAVVPLNSAGELAVYCSQASGTAHMVLDVNGYFDAP